jgi:hypothetical protein
MPNIPIEQTDSYINNINFNAGSQLIAPVSGANTTTTTQPPIQASVISINGLLRSQNSSLSNALDSLIISSGITDFVIFNPYIHYYQKVTASFITGGTQALTTIQPSANIQLARDRFNIYSREYR